MLPNLFIIGAAKCGTTSLHHYLGQHPSISMSSEKEPNFFAEGKPPLTLGEYERLFEAGVPIRGESSTNYSKHPAFPGVPQRIWKLVPDARLIYVVGEPLQRTLAHYAQTVATGLESRPFHSAVGDIEHPRNTYVWTSRYATQLEQYLDWFPRSSLLVLDQEKLRDERAATLRRTFSFVSVDETFTSPDFQLVLNSHRAQRRLKPAGAQLRRTRAARVYRKLPLGLKRPLSRSALYLLSRQVRRPTIDPSLRSELSAVYAEEIERLATLAGEQFAWTSEDPLVGDRSAPPTA